MSDVDVDVVVIGAGISGLATAKACLDAGLSVILFEKSDFIGGLWHYREGGYGVMSFTHINVSRHNYSFSDFPNTLGVGDFVHHSDMAAYIEAYADKFRLRDVIQFRSAVQSVSRAADGSWEVKVERESGGTTVTTSSAVAIASGHHAAPNTVTFPGQKGFSGTVMHSVDYKDAGKHGLVDKAVTVVGIGNSAVDVAENLVTAGCRVNLSTRSGAWVFPNYLFGSPMDHFANRLFLKLPWQVSNWILETLITCVHGAPTQYGLKPRMKMLQTQPTVSPTLFHRIQRGQIVIKPNIASFKPDGRVVQFEDGSEEEADAVVMCTGFHIGLPFLARDLAAKCLDEGSNSISLYKNVFAPELGPSLAFIGFVQPASGGLVPMSEIQARWFAELCRKRVSLPSPAAMKATMEKEAAVVAKRYFGSRRHTIQKDPLPYCDDIASRIGAKPSVLRFPLLAWRLLFGSGGTAQYRLQGPNAWDGAAETVRRVPVPAMWRWTAAIVALAVFVPTAYVCARLAFFLLG